LKIAINITTNKQALLQLHVLFAWDMKFNRKYVGPIHHTKQEGVCVLHGVFEGRVRVDAPG